MTTITNTGTTFSPRSAQAPEYAPLARFVSSARMTRRLVEGLEEQIRRVIERARDIGVTWEEIGEWLDMTPQQVWSFYTEPVRRMLAENAAASGLTEEQAEEQAVAAVKKVRAEQRQHEQNLAASARGD